jgi:predicted DNA-binding protein YlxM (UPF0122 family)
MKPVAFYKSQAWLTRRYRDQKKTISEIAKECQVSDQTILNYLNKFNLIKSPRSWKRGS